MKRFLKFVQLEKKRLRNPQLLYWQLKMSPRKLASFYRVYNQWKKDQRLGRTHSSVDKAIFDCSLLPFENHENAPRQKNEEKTQYSEHPIWFFTDTIKQYPKE